MKKSPKSDVKWTDEDMEAAVGSMSQRQAAQKYCVPRATLQKIIKGKTHIARRRR